jgi:hypothetical protein
MQLDDLGIYVATVDERSFTAAAKRLQPPVHDDAGLPRVCPTSDAKARGWKVRELRVRELTWAEGRAK